MLMFALLASGRHTHQIHTRLSSSHQLTTANSKRRLPLSTFLRPRRQSDARRWCLGVRYEVNLIPSCAGMSGFSGEGGASTKTHCRAEIRITAYLLPFLRLLINRARPPVINGVPPSGLMVYQSVHPSVNLALPPSITLTGVTPEWSGVLPPSTPPPPSAGKEQGMTTDNTGQGERAYAHSKYSAATRLLVGFHVGCICIFRRQMNAYANADNADSNQRAPSPPLRPSSSLFLSSPLCISLLVGLYLPLPVAVNLPLRSLYL